MVMKDCINNLTHSLLQQGDEIRQQSYGAAPSATKDLTTTSSGDGRAIRSDAKNQPFTSPTASHGTGATHAGTPRTPGSTLTKATPTQNIILYRVKPYGTYLVFSKKP